MAHQFSHILHFCIGAIYCVFAYGITHNSVLAESANLAQNKISEGGEHQNWDEYGVDDEDSKKSQKKRAPQYNRYSGSIIRLCNELRKDGRADALMAMAIAGSEEEAECLACRPFFKMVAASCKERKKRAAARKKGEPEVTPTPVVKQRDPSSQVVAAVSVIFNALSEETSAAETLLAVQKLDRVLREPNQKSVAEREYFDALAGYILSPFSRLKPSEESARQSDRAQPEKSEEVKEERKKNLDSLFEN